MAGVGSLQRNTRHRTSNIQVCCIDCNTSCSIQHKWMINQNTVFGFLPFHRSSLPSLHLLYFPAFSIPRSCNIHPFFMPASFPHFALLISLILPLFFLQSSINNFHSVSFHFLPHLLFVPFTSICFLSLRLLHHSILWSAAFFTFGRTYTSPDAIDATLFVVWRRDTEQARGSYLHERCIRLRILPHKDLYFLVG
jgi:hypothetical protein